MPRRLPMRRSRPFFGVMRNRARPMRLARDAAPLVGAEFHYRATDCYGLRNGESELAAEVGDLEAHKYEYRRHFRGEQIPAGLQLTSGDIRI